MSAPDIAGRGIANPTALLLAAALMLEHVDHDADADRLRNALTRTLREDSVRTRDLGGRATTAEFAKAIVARLR